MNDTPGSTKLSDLGPPRRPTGLLVFAFLALLIGLGILIFPRSVGLQPPKLPPGEMQARASADELFYGELKCGSPLFPGDSEPVITTLMDRPVEGGSMPLSMRLDCSDKLTSQRRWGVAVIVAGLLFGVTWLVERFDKSERLALHYPARWYSDPLETHAWRYWDGYTWTRHTSDAEAPPSTWTGGPTAV